ncbi:MAG: tRNA (adenosine(37)-N6)-threonylcarbamoyltransferase complex ATPase subunit type 1 TsaE [Pseudomonadota bacterium]
MQDPSKPPPDAAASEDAASLTLFLADAEATERIGEALAPILRAGDAVLLIGDLGAGKSAFARAAIQTRLEADGRREEVPSPSFTLVQTYRTASVEIWHADLHRLSGPEAIDELGLDLAFEEAITFVEWPDRLEVWTPERRLEIELTEAGDGRRLEARAIGGGWAAALSAMERAL